MLMVARVSGCFKVYCCFGLWLLGFIVVFLLFMVVSVYGWVYCCSGLGLLGFGVARFMVVIVYGCYGLGLFGFGAVMVYGCH